MFASFRSLRRRWRDIHLRVERLEKRQRETDQILDGLLADETFTPGEDAGMNGQAGRKAIVNELFARITFIAAVETGTFMGQSTGYLATSFGVPVHSCELLPRYHLVARRRLRHLSNVHLHHGDARAFLATLAHTYAPDSGPLFFYLDAHWYDDLPLEEEMRLIASQWTEFVVLIDDFQVPGDPGYGFDRYGDCNLSLDLLPPALQASGIQVFFPAMPSSQESGRKRGCVLLASPSLVGAVRECGTLRPWIGTQ